MKFYDDHADERDRFAIVAFHDVGAKTFEELDEQLEAKGIVQERWGGRPLPFATLLIDPEGVLVRIGGHGEAIAELEKVLEDE